MVKRLLVCGLCLFWAVAVSACAKKIAVSQGDGLTGKTGVAAQKAAATPSDTRSAEIVTPRPVFDESAASFEGGADSGEEAALREQGSKAFGRDFPVKQGRTTQGLQPVYFDFDLHTVRPDMVQQLETNARWLKKNPEAKIRIEGNTDERGSTEYNLALGERRANSAGEYLTNLGISPDRIETLSYGEERPCALEHSEDAWCINRRDDFVALKAKESGT